MPLNILMINLIFDIKIYCYKIHFIVRLLRVHKIYTRKIDYNHNYMLLKIIIIPLEDF